MMRHCKHLVCNVSKCISPPNTAVRETSEEIRGENIPPHPIRSIGFYDARVIV